MTAIEQQEPDQAVGFIHSEIERSIAQRCGDFGFDGEAILRRQEIVRCIHGASPDVHDSLSIRRA